ncbi:MAG: hypothetical protein P4L98_23340 [Ancalomicrobiaceae bacterium]|nr:hypothetical protein [Ancalomicrobiaceae bacterium]
METGSHTASGAFPTECAANATSASGGHDRRLTRLRHRLAQQSALGPLGVEGTALNSNRYLAGNAVPFTPSR